MKILHIAAHMGAGAGKAISGMALSDRENRHRILLLDKPEKSDHIIRCRQRGIGVLAGTQKELLKKEASEADVVVVNWWHHPLTYKALAELSALPSRLVLWSHVNGLNYPRLKPEFAERFDACMFTSKASFQNPDWNKEERAGIEEHSELVYGMGDFQPQGFPAKQHYDIGRTIRIGYVGSLDYAKLHPDFSRWLKATVECNKNIKFEIAGDVTQTLAEDVEKMGISENVQFLGFRMDIQELLPLWDMFIYPLNPFNFATTENALLEALASGLPVVASDGTVEKTIIEDGVNGLLVSDKDRFAEKIKELSENKDLRKALGQKARADMIENYDVEKNRSRFSEVMNRVVKTPKKTHDFKSILGEDAFSWFLSGCGKDEVGRLKALSECGRERPDWEQAVLSAAGFEEIYKGQSKGSAEQFSRYYPGDKRLKHLAGIMKESQETSI
ncbi:MAG: glycosyltransferase family 4 protein [Firmicutes bacterium]|nr:glycosyltransferase family 4 protein [Bacillota bacterium]